MNYVFATKPYQQRLGYLIGVILLTHPVNTTDFPTLQRKILQRFKLKEKYWNPPKRVKDISHTRDIIQWAKDIDLITKRQHRWSWKGGVLNTLTTDKQKDAFLSKNSHVPNLLNRSNFTKEQKLFFLYIMIESDGYFLVPFARRIINENEIKVSSNKKFSENDFRELYSQSWIDLADALKNSSSYKKRKDGRTLEKKVKKLKPRTWYIKALSKLEPMVDLSFLKRMSDQMAHYAPIKERLAFFNTFPDLEDLIRRGVLEQFLREKFFENWSKTIGIKQDISKENRASLIEKHLAIIYSRLISPGWKIINRNELALLSCIEAFTSKPNLIIEFNEAMSFQRKLSDTYGPQEVQLFGDYEGKLSSIKIGNKTLNKILNP